MRPVTDQLSSDEIKTICATLRAIIEKGVEGDVVEFGCYEGGSAVAMQELLKIYDYPKQLWLYDSFAGLPEKTAEDESVRGAQFQRGELKASKARLQRNFIKRDVRLAHVVAGWFFELDPEDLPDQIAFAFLDGDYYESIMDSLKLIWPKLTAGSVVLIDDYQNAALPGVKKAIDEWADRYDLPVKIDKTIAIFTLGDRV
jgi:O-methyltransferase